MRRIAVLAILLLLATFIIACILIRNFGRGLKDQSKLYLSSLQSCLLNIVTPSLEESSSGIAARKIIVCPPRPNGHPSKPDEHRMRPLLSIRARTCILEICTIVTSHCPHILHHQFPRHGLNTTSPSHTISLALALRDLDHMFVPSRSLSSSDSSPSHPLPFFPACLVY